jgi:hypothetical protein
MSEIPNWMSYVYDEVCIENMIDEKGSLLRGDGFDYFAGRFLWIIDPSQDRFQMTEDTRYVVDTETDDVVALVCVNPAEKQRTMAGVLKATREGVVTTISRVRITFQGPPQKTWLKVGYRYQQLVTITL